MGIISQGFTSAAFHEESCRLVNLDLTAHLRRME